MNQKGFTLIELLAIIVILAVIAVITVPIILGIIESAEIGAVKDSAYGYKDAVEKWYVKSLQQNTESKLDGTYNVNEGRLNNNEIPLSGSIPSGGSLTYDNYVLTSGCLVFGEYEATFENGEVKNVRKGTCIPTIASCPGCVFRKSTTHKYTAGTNNGVSETLSENDVTENYQSLESTYFLGHILGANGSIQRSFACGIDHGVPFCFEGYDTTKYSSNVTLMNQIFGDYGCTAQVTDNTSACSGANTSGIINESGLAVANGTPGCAVLVTGESYCT